MGLFFFLGGGGVFLYDMHWPRRVPEIYCGKDTYIHRSSYLSFLRTENLFIREGAGSISLDEEDEEFRQRKNLFAAFGESQLFSFDPFANELRIVDVKDPSKLTVKEYGCTMLQ